MKRRAWMRSSSLFKTLAIIALVCSASSAPSAARGEEVAGLGVVVSQLYDEDFPEHMGAIVVLHVLPDSGANKSGIRAGDVILEVDGKQTAGREFGDIVLGSLRGRAGSSSDLKIKRVQEKDPIVVRVERTLIKYSPDTYK
jgi:C-terminal processing protease CtpA/Prc